MPLRFYRRFPYQKLASHRAADCVVGSRTLDTNTSAFIVGDPRDRIWQQPGAARLKGKRNGDYWHGGRTKEMIEVWKLIKSLR
jgi:hypothetical protein